MNLANQMIDFFYKMDTDAFDIFKYHKISHSGGYFPAFSKSVSDFAYNHIIPTGDVSIQDALRLAASEFDTLGRKHVACITPIPLEYDFVDKKGLHLINTDAWMLFSGRISRPYTHPLIEVCQVVKTNIIQYLDVFNKGFCDHIYGKLEDGYKIMEERSFGNPYKLKKIAFVNANPAGSISVMIKGKIGYIDAFAVVPEYRMGGETAKCLGSDVLYTCYKNGVEHIFIITAADTSLERFYEMNGFRTEFYSRFYTWGE